MRQLLQAFLFLACASSAFAQESVIIQYFDFKNELIEDEAAAVYIESLTKQETGSWLVQRRAATNGRLISEYYCTDPEKKIKQGLFTGYHANGQKSEAVFYDNNKKQGAGFAWYDNGAKDSVYQYFNGVPVDTCIRWYKEGMILSIMICDSAGTGMQRELYSDGNTKGFGPVLKGRKVGSWKFFERNGNPLMDVSFDRKSLVITQTCYDEKGKPYGGDCYYNIKPAFPGGEAAWQQFIMASTQYPIEAVLRQRQGMATIQFTIREDGTLSDFELMNNTNRLFYEEGLRVLKSSPQWNPARYLNKPIATKHFQSFMFRKK